MKQMVLLYINTELGLDDPDLVEELLSEYKGLIEKSVRSMHEAFDQRDYGELRGIAHALKGGSANIGAEPFRENAFGLQEAADAKDEERCKNFIQEIDRLVSNLDL